MMKPYKYASVPEYASGGTNKEDLVEAMETTARVTCIVAVSDGLR
jgi:hypothetical protein